MKTLTLLGTTLGLSFTAGLNLYATVLVTGLALRLHWVQLPPGLDGLSALEHPVVLAVAGQIDGRTATFTLYFTTPCSGSATGTATIGTRTISGTYSGGATGFGCCNPVSGSFVLQR